MGRGICEICGKSTNKDAVRCFKCRLKNGDARPREDTCKYITTHQDGIKTRCIFSVEYGSDYCHKHNSHAQQADEAVRAEIIQFTHTTEEEISEQIDDFKEQELDDDEIIEKISGNCKDVLSGIDPDFLKGEHKSLIINIFEKVCSTDPNFTPKSVSQKVKPCSIEYSDCPDCLGEFKKLKNKYEKGELKPRYDDFGNEIENFSVKMTAFCSENCAICISIRKGRHEKAVEKVLKTIRTKELEKSISTAESDKFSKGMWKPYPGKNIRMLTIDLSLEIPIETSIEVYKTFVQKIASSKSLLIDSLSYIFESTSRGFPRVHILSSFPAGNGHLFSKNTINRFIISSSRRHNVPEHIIEKMTKYGKSYKIQDTIREKEIIEASRWVNYLLKYTNEDDVRGDSIYQVVANMIRFTL